LWWITPGGWLAAGDGHRDRVCHQLGLECVSHSEEIVEIAAMLRKAAGLPKKPTGAVANG
jgi:hypothetical protein